MSLGGVVWFWANMPIKWVSYGWAKVGKGWQCSQFNLEDFLLNNFVVIVKIWNFQFVD